jgi:hypothetical protein
MKRLISALACVLIALTGPSHAAGLVDAADAGQLAGLIRDLGYRARVETDNVGDPMIVSSVGGTDFSILFYGCENGANCTSLLFKVGFDLTEGATLEAVNAWNEKNLFGRAYLDDEADPWIEMPVNLFGGVSRENFEDSFDWWDVVVGRFEDHLGL